jgi:hypothetical protein
MPFSFHWWSQNDCTLCNMLDCARPAPFSRTELVLQSCVPLYQCRGDVLHSLVYLCSLLLLVSLHLASSRFISPHVRFILASTSLHPRLASFILASSPSLYPRFILTSSSLQLRFILLLRFISLRLTISLHVFAEYFRSKFALLQ